MKRLSLLLLALCIACKPSPQQPAQPGAAEPQVRATVVTIRTTLQPENKTFTHTLVIAGDVARDTGELETWRLYDTKASTVTFVDELEKTVRTEPLADITRKRTAGLANTLPSHFARVELTRTKERKPLLGASAERVVIESGTYQRELWLAEHPAIPRGLFAMMHASDALSSPLAPMMRAADEALVETRGFPLADRTTVPLASGNLVIERTVTGIATQQVPASVVTVPKGYRDITPKPPPDAGKK